MKYAKRIVIVLLVYVGIVVAFESMIGFFQPIAGDNLIITTTDAGGAATDRVLARLETNGHLYVAANHWPRAWYRQALANPNVSVTIQDEKGAYTVVRVSGAEHDLVEAEHRAPIFFKILTGFPPRYFLRLDPR